MKKRINCILWMCIFTFLFFSPFLLFSQTNSCVECHQQLGKELQSPVEGFKNDIHQELGLDCSSCHGGNPQKEDIEEAKDRTFLGAPARTQIPQFCGECHSDSQYMSRFDPEIRVDQLSIYWSSQHGQLLKKGDKKVAVCTDCHGIHEIKSADQPRSPVFPWKIPETCGKCHSDQEYMEEYKISTHQVKKYKQSVHAQALFEKKDLSAPVCNDCHGNHGAVPPRVSSIAYVCRQCHRSNFRLFSESPHKPVFKELGISECEACHGNHKILPISDEMLGTGEKAVCIQCHESGSEPYSTASRIKSKLDSFVDKIHKAEQTLEKAERKGVEVSDPKYQLNKVRTKLIQARNLTHTLSVEQIEQKIMEGREILSGVQRSGNAALKEAKQRRIGLVVVTFFIFLLIAALFLKIKHLYKKSSSS